MIVFRALTHIIFALNMAVLARMPTVAFPLIALGAILPDIDCQFSPVGRQVGVVSHLFGRHRSRTHSFLATFIVALFNTSVAFGYLTHILVDLLNPTGCRLFFPAHKWVKIGIIRCGGFGEFLFGAALGAVLIMNFMPVTLW